MFARLRHVLRVVPCCEISGEQCFGKFWIDLTSHEQSKEAIGVTAGSNMSFACLQSTSQAKLCVWHDVEGAQARLIVLIKPSFITLARDIGSFQLKLSVRNFRSINHQFCLKGLDDLSNNLKLSIVSFHDAHSMPESS